MEFTVYILKSQKDQKYYYGYSRDVESRLLQHNLGQVKSTRSRIPFDLHYTEKFKTKREAIQREHYFKSYDGYKWLKTKQII
ncbi:MAG: GIY-YIG nuclease family protein [Crocinitomicaceae bacterium]|nr:GIY-YIG nuclease family protein [Crocinitomicaceae bacterium]